MFFKSSSKNSFKNSLKGFKIIALVSISSMIFTNVIIAQDLNAVAKIPTTYTANQSNSSTREVPTGYAKGNYKTKALPYWKTKKVETPAANELSLQEAAEIAAQELFKLYDIKLTGQTLEMSYYPKEDKNDINSWFVSVKITPDYCFDLSLEASNGKLIMINCQGGSNITKLSAKEDNKTITNGMAIARKGLSNPDQACEKVKALLTSKNFISEPIETIKYERSVYGTYCAVATPYSQVTHWFNVTTTSKKTYSVNVSQDLTSITSFSIQ